MAGIAADVAHAVGEVFGIANEGVAVSFLPDGTLAISVGEGAFPCLNELFHGHQWLEKKVEVVRHDDP